MVVALWKLDNIKEGSSIAQKCFSHFFHFNNSNHNCVYPFKLWIFKAYSRSNLEVTQESYESFTVQHYTVDA